MKLTTEYRVVYNTKDNQYIRTRAITFKDYRELTDLEVEYVKGIEGTIPTDEPWDITEIQRIFKESYYDKVEQTFKSKK